MEADALILNSRNQILFPDTQKDYNDSATLLIRSEQSSKQLLKFIMVQITMNHYMEL